MQIFLNGISTDSKFICDGRNIRPYYQDLFISLSARLIIHSLIDGHLIKTFFPDLILSHISGWSFRLSLSNLVSFFSNLAPCTLLYLSLIHISEPTRQAEISY